MKQLFTLYMLVISSYLSFSQNPLEWFDMARCHFANSVKLPIQQYPLTYVPQLAAISDSIKQLLPYSFWQKQEEDLVLVTKGIGVNGLGLNIDEKRKYYLVIQDVRYASFMVIEAQATRLEVKGFWGCALHY